MSGHVAHFAVNADDVDAARRFYEAAFGWRFEPWGPPSFFRVTTGAGDPPGPLGALQARRALDDGVPLRGFECTVAVDDLDAVMAAATASGGRVLMEPTVIAGVGTLAFLADPGDNVVGAMVYDPSVE